MDKATSERRLIENEKLFRNMNEQAQQGLEHVNQLAREDNQPEFITSADTLIHFFCECSNLKCTERIRIPMQRYGETHKDEDTFVVKPGHEVPSIERIVSRHSGYNVIRKLAKTI